MPNAKTTLRVAMAAVAAPGIIAGMAAPAAHAAELAPAMTTAAHSAGSHVSDAQHTSVDQAQHRATSSVDRSADRESVQKGHGDLTGSHVLQTGNMLNGQDMSV